MNFKTNIDKVSPILMEYRLPSGGVYYPQVGKLIKIRPFGFDTEAILVTNLLSTEKTGKIVSIVADLPEGFDVDDLVVGDWLFILAVSRALTYNESYDFSTVCDKCGEKEVHSLKIPDQLPVRIWTDDKEYAADAMTVHVKNFTFQLPHVKDTLEIKFPRARDVKMAQKYAESRKTLGPTTYDPAYVRGVSQHIKAINGTDLESKDYDQFERDYLLRLTGADFAFLKAKIRDLNCGILQKWDIQCNKCSENYTADIPLNYNFFR